MGRFICDECDVLENTARGHFWESRGESGNYDWFSDTSKNSKALCSQCMPSLYKDGKYTGRGKWHGHFKRTIMTEKYLLEHHAHNDYQDFNYLGRFEYLRGFSKEKL